MFRWLQLRGLGGQEEQMDMVWHTQALGAVPARTIQDKDDLPGRAGSDCRRECRKFCLEEWDAH